MQIALLTQSDHSVSDIVERLYNLKGVGPDVVRSLEDDMIKANPLLREKDQYIAGRLILVPDGARASFRQDRQVSEDEWKGLIQAIQETLATLPPLFSDAIKGEKSDLDLKSKLLKGRKVQDAIKDDSHALEVLNAAVAQAKGRFEAVSEALSSQSAGIQKLQEEFKLFRPN